MSLINHILSTKDEHLSIQDELSNYDNREELSIEDINTDAIVSSIMNVAYVHVEISCRKLLRKKILGFIKLYDKMPVFRLVYVTPESKNMESYEEYNSHAEIYKRLSSSPIYGKPFPSNIKINEFIDLGFTIIIG